MISHVYLTKVYLFLVQVSSYREKKKKHTYKKRQKQILSTQDPRKIGFCMKERKKKVNLNPLLEIVHKYLFKTIIGKLKHKS